MVSGDFGARVWECSIMAGGVWVECVVTGSSGRRGLAAYGRRECSITAGGRGGVKRADNRIFFGLRVYR